MNAPTFVDLEVDGEAVRIEHRWLAPARRDRPLMVFLHEGLGSVAMWRDFPARLVDALGDPARRHLVDEVKAMGLHLEVCPTSNVHTGVSPDLASHPITALWRAGVSLSFHTDNTLMSCISLVGEAQALLAQTPLQPTDLLQMQWQAAGASFLGADEKARAAAAIRAFAATQNMALNVTP